MFQLIINKLTKWNGKELSSEAFEFVFSTYEVLSIVICAFAILFIFRDVDVNFAADRMSILFLSVLLSSMLCLIIMVARFKFTITKLRWYLYIIRVLLGVALLYCFLQYFLDREYFSKIEAASLKYFFVPFLLTFLVIFTMQNIFFFLKSLLTHLKE